MELFNFKKKKKAPKEVLSITQADLDSMIEKALEAKMAQEKPEDKSSMNAEERTAWIEQCTTLGATEIQNEALKKDMTFLEATNLLVKETAELSKSLMEDFNSFNPSTGSGSEQDEKEKFTSIGEGIEALVAEAKAKGEKLTYKQAQTLLEAKQPELFNKEIGGK